MTRPGRGERTLQAAVTERAADLGANVRPRDVVLQYADVPGAPAYRLVRATWGAGGSADGLTGLLHGDDEPDLLPGHAIGSLLLAWESGAVKAAAAVAFLLDPLARWEPLLTEQDTSAWRSEDAEVGPPRLTTDHVADVRVRLTFWWRRATVAQQVVVDVDEAGRVVIGGGRRGVRPDEERGLS